MGAWSMPELFGPVLGTPGIGSIRNFETCDCWVHPGLIVHSEWAVEERLGCWSSGCMRKAACSRVTEAWRGDGA